MPSTRPLRGKHRGMQHRPTVPPSVVSKLLLFGLLGIAFLGLQLHAAAVEPVRFNFALDRPPREIVLSGFYGPEENAGGAFRWARPQAALTIPLDVPADYRIAITMQDSPEQGEPRSVTILVDGVALQTARLETTPRDFIVEYRPDLAAWRPPGHNNILLELRTGAFLPPGDPRLLGPVVMRLAVEPLRAPAPWQPAPIVPNLLLLALPYGALRAGGVRRARAAAVVAALLIAYAGLALGARTTALWLALQPAAQPLPTLALALFMLASPLVTPRWVGRARRASAGRFAFGLERLVPPLVAVAATLLLGSMLFGGHPEAARTTALCLLLAGALTTLLTVSLSPRAALGATFAALVIFFALAVPRPALAAEALARAVRTPALWGTLAWVAGGITVLLVLARRPTPAADALPGRQWPLLLAYALTAIGLAVWWQWGLGGPRRQLDALTGLGPLERQAVALVPAFILLGAGAQLLVALCLPTADWWRAIRADLTALLLLLGLPLGSIVLAQRPASERELALRITWLGLLLVPLVALRTLVVLRLLLRAAVGGASERRLGLAFFVVCLAVYWPLMAWRGVGHVGLMGDEQQYLAATMSLWRRGDLELTDSVLSPEMAALAQPPAPDGIPSVHIHEDTSRDRLVAVTAPAAPRRTLSLPLVAGDGLTATIQLLTPGAEPGEATVRYRDETGALVETHATTVRPGQPTTLRAPAGRAGWLSASIDARIPVLAAVRLKAPTAGDEIYSAGGAVPTLPSGAVAPQCLPMDLSGGSWETRLIFVQNSQPATARATWQRFDAAGEMSAEGAFAIAPHGVIALPLAAGGIGTVCVAGDGPLATLLLARGAPGLLALPGGMPLTGRIIIPEPPRDFAPSRSTVLLHNPNPDPIQVLLPATGGSITIPPRGIQQLARPAEGWSWSDSAEALAIEPTAPIVISTIATFGGHMTMLSPASPMPDADALVIPLVAPDSALHTLAQLTLTNYGPGQALVTATLRDTTGRVVRRERVALCPSCTITHPFWYKEPAGGMLAFEANEPIAATLLQREVRTRWPFHSIGLSLAMVPGYALAGAGGALATVGLLAALVPLGLFGLLRRAGVGRRNALVVAGLLGCSSPLVTYATQLAPELAGAGLIVLALLLLDDWLRRGGLVLLPALAGVAGAPLFHSRLLPLSLIVLGALCAALATRALRRTRERGLAPYQRLGLLAALLAAPLVFGAVWALEPRVHPAYLRQYFSLATVGRHALGILLDRATGLLPGVPLLALAGGGFVWTIRRAPFLGLTALALAGAQVLFVALRSSGWEIWGPPGRYVLPAVPFLGLALGAAWEWGFAGPVRLVARALAGWGLLVALLFTWIPASAYYALWPPFWHADEILQGLLGANPLHLFPQILRTAPPTDRQALGWAGALLAGALLGLSAPWRLPRWHWSGRDRARWQAGRAGR